MNLRPEFFDVFGVVAFAYVVCVSLFALRKKRLPKAVFVALLLVGLIGLFVDGAIVYVSFLAR